MSKYIDTWGIHYRIAGKTLAEASSVEVQQHDYYDYEFLVPDLFETRDEADNWLTLERIYKRSLPADQEVPALLEVIDRMKAQIKELEGY